MRSPFTSTSHHTPAVWSEPLTEGRPLVVCLHGYSSNEADVFTISDRLGERPVFAAPRAASRSATPYLGFAWFPLAVGRDGALLGAGDTPADRAAAAGIGLGATDAAAHVFRWLDAVVADGPSPSSVGLVGFSQGGIVAAQMLRMHPERIAATVLLSSMVAPGEMPGDARLAELRPPVYFGWGERDEVVPAAATAHSRAWLDGHASVTTHPEPALGHEVSNEQLRAVAGFLDERLP